MLIDCLVFLLLAATFVISAYQIAQLDLCYRYWKDVLWGKRVPTPPLDETDLPFVTVQLPMFNEGSVAPRVIEAVSRFDYPLDRFEIQVLDDSIDNESSPIIKGAIETAREAVPGLNITWIHRDNRTGFKAGALQEGLAVARGVYIAVFDADFVPSPDFLRQTIPWFNDPKIAAVQSRWGHLNARDSVVTSFQEYFLDGHCSVEQRGRNSAGYFMNFNGTAGVWRKEAIEDAGGWEHDTIVEDIDLSYRAQLRGWRMKYLEDYVTFGELPNSMLALRVQLFRWFKGNAQVARKALPLVLRSSQPLRVKLQACAHLLASCSIGLALFVTVMHGMMPALLALSPDSARYLGLSLVGFTWVPFVILVFGTPRIRFDKGPIIPRFFRFVARTFVFLAVMAALTGQGTMAALQGIFGKRGEWVVTPKGFTTGTGPARAKRRKLPSYVRLDLAILVYMIAAISLSAYHGYYVAIVFQSVWLVGYLWLFTSCWREARAQTGRSSPLPIPALATSPESSVEGSASLSLAESVAMGK